MARIKIDRTKLSKFTYKGKTYDVFIVRKRGLRRYTARSQEGVLLLTCPYEATIDEIRKTMNSLLPKYIEKFVLDHYKAISVEDHYVYIFGSTVPLYISDKNYFSSEGIIVKDIPTLEKYLKKILLEYLKLRVQEYAQIMGIKRDYYKVTVKKMKTRLGSNSAQTKTLAFQLNLVFYKKDVIDTVIVHELAHYYHPDHSKKFYKTVLKYCPDYHMLQRALKRGKLLNEY